MSYTFTPPSIDEAPAGGGPLFGRFRIARGITLLKQGDTCTFIEVRYPTQDELDAASRVYLGGYTYAVSDDEAACLASAGYGALLSDGSDIPVDPGGTSLGYGEGGYGEGDYGL